MIGCRPSGGNVRRISEIQVAPTLGFKSAYAEAIARRSVAYLFSCIKLTMYYA